MVDDKATAINLLIDAVQAIEQELGLTPSGIYDNVRSRLDILESRGLKATGSGYTIPFTSADGYVFSVTHNLNSSYPAVIIYNDSGVVVAPDEILTLSANSIQLDITTQGTISGTWHVTVVSGSL
ncbi:hypothetical protein UFOVP1290_68 [uncultured Caudovirales phage]|uniref:Uncharacterized protein n=1 Tax=uncultured Caudovirales phage TaxID=2100421 RepID=A0A6J5RS90_9CAUD|nr:hypothetical protein UFOVP1290_68 [uncultured Caudovirales phage]